MFSNQSKNAAKCPVAAFIVAFVLVLSMVFYLPASALAKNGSVAGFLTTGMSASKGTATVLVYMNGSDLESEAGEATTDIAEMLESGAGDNVNIIIETLGTREWQDYGIASDHTQRYRVNKGSLELVDDSLGQLDTTSPDTLSDFISWGVKNYPADRYMLVMWDHGAGPVYGFGVDEFQSEDAALTLDEMQDAFEANSDVHFDFIGMDCCIMSSLESYYVFAPFCDYAILSEDFEPGTGWSYKNWLSKLEADPAVDTVELGTAIVDDMVAASAEDSENGEATLALVDESAIPELYSAWLAFAYENEEALVGTNYSQEASQHGHQGHDFGMGMRPGGFGHGLSDWWHDDGWHDNGWYDNGRYDDGWYDDGWGYDQNAEDSFWDYWDSDESDVTLSDYSVTDLMAAADSADGNAAAALKAAYDKAIVHYNCTAGDAEMTGMGVTLPYGDDYLYDELVDVFTACGFDKEYVSWLGSFVDSSDSRVLPYTPQGYMEGMSHGGEGMRMSA